MQLILELTGMISIGMMYVQSGYVRLLAVFFTNGRCSQCYGCVRLFHWRLRDSGASGVGWWWSSVHHLQSRIQTPHFWGFSGYGRSRVMFHFTINSDLVKSNKSHLSTECFLNLGVTCCLCTVTHWQWKLKLHVALGIDFEVTAQRKVGLYEDAFSRKFYKKRYY